MLDLMLMERAKEFSAPLGAIYPKVIVGAGRSLSMHVVAASTTNSPGFPLDIT